MAFFFNKKNAINTIDFTQPIPVTLDVTNHSEVQKQIALIHLAKNDLAILHHLQPHIEKILNSTVDSFYKSLEAEPSLMKIIANHQSVERLKKTLYYHINEMFGGVIDSNYLSQRKKIAQVHVKIGLNQNGIWEHLKLYNTNFLVALLNYHYPLMIDVMP